MSRYRQHGEQGMRALAILLRLLSEWLEGWADQLKPKEPK